MFRLFSKFYFFAFLFFLIMIKAMITSEFYLICVFGYAWVPQIIWNILNRTRKAPLISFAIASSVFHVHIPIYFRLIPNNFIMLRPKEEAILEILIA